ncbi:transcriptional regulator, AlpA family [Polaromonas sp. OV174]|uniref:helix-turn-helix transcriptional regulator n=1 Tax=Polaromonas sp. OV174 TaxID=1855300 RepID=UPI0008EF2DB5|nr:AlpA family phage regulatory protein [Polaromonas sp. OV174]SFC11034.1 transcriptional regulator, AlpA family [Polaromonas sp. OV174]
MASIDVRDLIEDDLIDLSEVEKITSLSGKHIYALERAGRFPKRVKLGRRSAWVKREVYAWVRDKVLSRPVVATYPPLIRPRRHNTSSGTTGEAKTSRLHEGRGQPRPNIQRDEVTL